MEDKELNEVLGESPSSVADLLKAAAHKSRIVILTMMLEGKQDLSNIVDETAMSRNAAINHLSQLMEANLVERVGRGEYSLTQDGRDLIQAAATIYMNSNLRRAQKQVLSQKLYASGWRGDDLSETIIDREASYQPCWISYTGAMAGALKSMSVDCDMTDVGGYSGYAFIVNVIKGEFCPSGPTAFHPSTWEEMHWGVQDLGYRLVHWADMGSYPEAEGPPKPNEIERAKRLFDLVKPEIEGNKPVVLWGLYAPEYGIVKGISGNSYIVSSFRGLIGQPEDPVPYHDLKAPGCLDAHFIREPIEVGRMEADRRAIERGLKFARGAMPVSDRYVHGLDAWTEWAEVLENHPEQTLYHGNSYNAVCYHEARLMASEFLERVVSRQSGPYSKNLMEASKIYGKAAGLLEEFTEIFPFKFEGEMSPENRKKGASLIRKVRSFDGKAIEQMEKALKKW